MHSTHLFAALVESVLSFRWLPFCLLGVHKSYSYIEARKWRRICDRCGKTLEVGP